ncbi:hypothetical protein JRO89_XS12G0229200 [Xanthoceras sorbifolium]|uniref:RING-type domain-containing protein n=1 Tax=Xanthoceras sorbifolium TaxID=99658 RepID=A0ABQ8HDD6_9ROSI|nr:hypothetical protein JRO89_XS12G0229200 [Xanthoceras sorbifolium]
MLISVSLLVFVLFSLAVLVLLLVFHFVFRNRLNNQSAGAHDMEGGLQEAGTNHYQGTESNQKPQKNPFSEVSWTAFREKCQHPDEEEEANVCSEFVICLEEFKNGELCKFREECNHIYHKACIDRGLVKDARCPLCRGFVHSPGPGETHTGSSCRSGFSRAS